MCSQTCVHHRLSLGACCIGGFSLLCVRVTCFVVCCLSSSRAAALQLTGCMHASPAVECHAHSVGTAPPATSHNAGGDALELTYQLVLCFPSKPRAQCFMRSLQATSTSYAAAVHVQMCLLPSLSVIGIGPANGVAVVCARCRALSHLVAAAWFSVALCS